MAVRPSLLAVALAALAAIVPAAAHAREEHGKAGEIAETLSDPMTQYAVAGMLSAMSRAVLDMEAEPLVRALKQLGGGAMADLPDDATVGDLTGADPEAIRETIVAKVPPAMKAMGAMAGAVEAMAPELEQVARRMRESARGF